MKNVLLTLSIFLLVLSVKAQDIKSDLGFLAGTWKVTDKETFEEWALQSDGSLKGESYKLVNDQKELVETLAIIKVGSDIYYEATVLDQNDGKAIRFKLTGTKGNKFVFENATHDFPKKIVYEKVNDTFLSISVTGDQNRGFSFKMVKPQ